LIGRRAVEFIEGCAEGEPWFLYVPFNAPHSPYQAKPVDLKKYPQLKMKERKAYAAMVDCMDQNIGKILDALEKRADADNTVVWFFSDNGGIRRVGSSNGPWRDGKLSVYEGGTRVCAALRWPAGGLGAGRVFEGRVGYIDLLPTLLAAAGGVLPPGAVDGVDVMPALRGEQPLPERPWFSYMHQNEEAHASVHLGQMKLVAHGDFFAEAGEVRYELYDLSADPAESADLASEQPEVVTDLGARLRAFGGLQKPGVGLYHEGREGFTAPKDWILINP
jgi:arylsulfatase B